MRRGEVWWFELAELGRRPAVILTRDAAIPVLRRVMTAGVTRTVRGAPTEVALSPGDGMPVECIAALDDVRMLPRALAVERITALSPERMHEVCLALDIATACDGHVR